MILIILVIGSIFDFYFFVFFEHWGRVLDQSIVVLFLVLFFVTAAAGRSQGSHECVFVFLCPVVSNLIPLAEDTLIANVRLEVVIVDVIVTLEHGHLDRPRHWRGEFVADHEKTRKRLIFHHRTCSGGANRIISIFYSRRLIRF